MNISIEHFTKKIRGVAVLDDVSLELQGGYIYGLQGKNGSGRHPEKYILMVKNCTGT